MSNRCAIPRGALISLLFVALGATSYTQQRGPGFVGGTTMVPVDVRVVDDSGRPVTDLKQKDFTISEEGVKQRIALFSTESTNATTPASTGGSANESSQRRVFLIVLGRGRLDVVSGGIDAAIRFVADSLSREDVVAVTAWNRATPFTKDRAAIEDVLSRYQRANAQIESDLTNLTQGLAGEYGQSTGQTFGPAVQSKIDDVFRGFTSHELPVAGTVPLTDDRAALDALSTLAKAQASANPNQQKTIKNDEVREAGLSGAQSLDAYIERRTRTRDDLTKLYLGIDYLRSIDGEKELIFVTEHGVLAASADDEHDLAAYASDARVALHYVQTGGATVVNPYALSPESAGAEAYQGFAVAALEGFAERTGGTGSIYSYAAKGFDAVDRATRFQYLLGYVSTGVPPTAKYRHINVKVARSHVTVLFRHGYFLDRPPSAWERQIVAYPAVMGALSDRSRQDFPMRATASDINVGAVDLDMQPTSITVEVDAGQLHFDQASAKAVAALDIAVFMTGPHGPLPTSWHTVDMALPATAARPSGWQRFTFMVRTPARPSEIMVVVLEANPTLVASSYARMKGK